MSLPPPLRADALDRSESRREVRAALGAALASLRPDETVLVAVPLPPGDPAAALAVCPEEAFLWRAAGETWIGLGAAERLRARGPDRCAQLETAVRARSASLRWVETAPGLRALAGGRARWFGGLSFAPGGADEAPWHGFGDAELVLARWLVGGASDSSRGGAGNVGVLAVRGAGAAADDRLERTLDRALSELSEIVAALRASGRAGEGEDDGASRPRGTASRRDVDAGARGRYRDTVERAILSIACARARKLVPARRVELALEEPVDLLASIARLARSAAPGSSALFAFVRGDRAFVGATPERLVRLRGRLVETHALAGSERPSGSGPEAARRLSGRPKDRREHAWVVRHLVERLRPLCARLAWPPEPRVLELPHVLHLETPIEGELRERRHVLELVDRLHPTPAVAGYPIEAAARWLARHEPAPRGWYAGPVGWCDEAGDGDFRVALRALLLAPSRAYLYAGAGVVEGSDPDAELRETDLKLEPARSALFGTPEREPADADAPVPLPV
jgi:menaquinone-specific isochorismate synthase